MTSVVLDTSAFFALVDTADEHHAAAAAALGRLDGRDLSTTNYITTETLSLVSNRLGMDRARTLHRAAMQPLEMLWTSPIEHAHAVESFFESGRTLSFVDCATMAVMRARAIHSIFSFDEDFRRAGFDVIP